MSARQAAGLEPMHHSIRLHGCHRVGNQITGLDPASPEADRTVYIVPVSPPDNWVFEMFVVDPREAIRKAFFVTDWLS